MKNKNNIEVTIKQLKKNNGDKALYVGTNDECFKFCMDNKLWLVTETPVGSPFYEEESYKKNDTKILWFVECKEKS